MQESVIVRELVGFYGKKQALRGVTFTVGRGEIFGLIGPNGAGKTTTLRIIATLLYPSGGEVIVEGYDVVKEPEKVREILSYLPEDAGTYDRLTGREFLKFFAELTATNADEVEEMVSRGAEIAGLGSRLYDKTKEYSKGMKRRLLLARALMTMPKVALLDEPTAGLDVTHAVYTRNIIKDFSKKYRTTVLLSSHNMLEVENLCDRVAFINQGKIIAIGSPKKLLDMYNASDLEEAFVKAVSSSERQEV